MVAAGLAIPSRFFLGMLAGAPAHQSPLEQFDYGDVDFRNRFHNYGPFEIKGTGYSEGATLSIADFTGTYIDALLARYSPPAR